MVRPVIRAIPVVAESARYTPSVLYLPGLWGRAPLWGHVPAALAHRGWEGALVEFDDREPGGIALRADALAIHVRTLPHPPVLVAHDAGAVVALAASGRTPVAALVLLAPLAPGWSLRLLVRRLDALAALVRGRPVPPPAPSLVARVLGLPPGGFGAGRGPEPAATVLDVLRGRVSAPPPPGTPVLLVSGTTDPHLRPAAAAAMAALLGAETQVIDGAGHWLPLEPSWQATAAAIHRWLVQRLGADVLELHAEAMAERGDDPD